MAYLDYYDKNPFVQENEFLRMEPESEKIPSLTEVRELLPAPFWEGNNQVIDCYWKAWEIAFNNLKSPTVENGFVSNYIDTAFNNCLFMWDSAFIMHFARYGNRAFNFQKTLNNFYAKQHPDGFICREIREDNGRDQFHRFDPVSTGPNILPWAEWEYFLHTGDRERLQKVFPPLVAYHQWLREHRTWRSGAYWSSGLGSGMDNQPRVRNGYSARLSHGHQIWVDTCLQQVLSARIILKMAEVLKREVDVQDFKLELVNLTHFIKEKLWDEETAFYYDLWPEEKEDTGSKLYFGYETDKNGELSRVKTIGAYWALLAGLVPQGSLEAFIAHLEDPAEFQRPHPVPSLSAEHPEYQFDGGYWKGGVWPPTNYMVLRGLTEYGFDALAHSIGLEHLRRVVEVFQKTGTLWENYSPEISAPGQPAKDDFVGWSGLPPIAVFIEYILGIRPNVPESSIIWDVRLIDEHGIEGYPFGKGGLINLRCQKRSTTKEKPSITVEANIQVNLDLRWEGGREVLKITP
jgi:glycogen debranching enzyme